MADSDNVVPLRPLGPGRKDPTAVARKRRSRAKRRIQVTPVTPAPSHDVTPPITVPVTVERHDGRGVTIATTIAAMSLATVSAGFSITGMTSIFIGSFWPVIAMGVALESGKLSAVAWLARHRATAPRRLRAALIALVAVLMGLNAIGAYGFLAKAHIGHTVEGDVAAAGKIADVDARIGIQTSLVSDHDARIRQIDAAIDKATQRGRTGSAMKIADDQRKTRADLVAQRGTAAKALAVLQVERATIDGQRKVAEAPIGKGVYFCAAALRTADHIRLLEEAEKLLS
jgi:hypothetical protein